MLDPKSPLCLLDGELAGGKLYGGEASLRRTAGRVLGVEEDARGVAGYRLVDFLGETMTMVGPRVP